MQNKILFLPYKKVKVVEKVNIQTSESYNQELLTTTMGENHRIGDTEDRIRPYEFEESTAERKTKKIIKLYDDVVQDSKVNQRQSSRRDRDDVPYHGHRRFSFKQNGKDVL